MLDTALESVDAYVALFASQELPVLRHTVRALEALSDRQDSIHGKRIAGIVLSDPLMTLKLIVHLQANRPPSRNHDITTIDRAIMMMGVTPFLATFANMPTLEDRLAGHPKALLGALRVIGRARRAAHLAHDWAIVRHDLDVDEITVAALLREATGILLWTFAPALSLRVQAVQRLAPDVPPAVAQRSVFRVTESELQLALANAWNMPELLVTLLDEAHWENPRVRNVRLASDLARHLAEGWNNPALAGDLDEIEKLLHIGREPLLKRLGASPEAMHRFISEQEHATAQPARSISPNAPSPAQAPGDAMLRDRE